EIPDRLLLAEPLEDNELKLEGHKLVVVNAGRTDTAHSTCLYVPSIGLIVGGDAVYNGIPPYLSETDTGSRLEWISTLDKLEALKPKAVVAGHKVPENDDDPRIIAAAIPSRFQQRLRASSTTQCWKSIPIASTRAPSGARQTPPRSKREKSSRFRRAMLSGIEADLRPRSNSTLFPPSRFFKLLNMPSECGDLIGFRQRFPLR